MRKTFMVVVIVLLALSACAEPGTEVIERIEEVEVTRIVEEIVEVEVVVEKVVTATPPPATATPDTPEVGTRRSPAGIGDRLLVEGSDFLVGEYVLELEMLELISGEPAWEIAQEGNMFNSPPDDGMEYILAKFYVAVLEVAEEPFGMNHAKWDAVSSDGRVYGGFLSLSGIEPTLRIELYEGASHEGWTYFMVEQGDSPLAVFDRGRDSEVWFTLR